MSIKIKYAFVALENIWCQIQGDYKASDPHATFISPAMG